MDHRQGAGERGFLPVLEEDSCCGVQAPAQRGGDRALQPARDQLVGLEEQGGRVPGDLHRQGLPAGLRHPLRLQAPRGGRGQLRQRLRLVSDRLPEPRWQRLASEAPHPGRPLLHRRRGQSRQGGGCECEEYYPNCEVMFMGMANIHSIRNSFQSLRAVCSQIPDPGNWLSALESTRWLQHLSVMLKAATLVCSAVEREGRPVLVHCSDGWDRTPQIVALAKILLDPYYRTMEGFQVLVETEWLDYGHKFGDRCGHQENADDVSEQCPVFLQWLDCVHQLLKQFPCLFEFNEAFLVKLVQHTYSCLYGTFLCNNAKEREARNVYKRTCSVWSLLRAGNKNFQNFLYIPSHDMVLQPVCHTRALQLWTAVYLPTSSPCTAADDSMELYLSPSTQGEELTSRSLDRLPKTRSMDNLVSACENGVPLTRTSSDPNLNKHCQEDRPALEPAPGVGGGTADGPEKATTETEGRLTPPRPPLAPPLANGHAFPIPPPLLGAEAEPRTADRTPSPNADAHILTVCNGPPAGSRDRPPAPPTAVELLTFKNLSPASPAEDSARTPAEQRAKPPHLKAARPAAAEEEREEEEDREEEEEEEEEDAEEEEEEEEGGARAAPTPTAGGWRGGCSARGSWASWACWALAGRACRAWCSRPAGPSSPAPRAGGWRAGCCAPRAWRPAGSAAAGERRPPPAAPSTPAGCRPCEAPPSARPGCWPPPPPRPPPPPPRRRRRRAAAAARPAYLDDDGLPVAMDAVQQRLRQIEAGYKQEVEVLRRQVRQLQMRLESKQYCTPSEPDVDYEDDITCLRESDDSEEEDSLSDRSEDRFSEGSWDRVERKDTEVSVPECLLQVTRWVPDHMASHCFNCDCEFWIVKRRHHCRNCGNVFCKDCCHLKLPIPDQQLYDPVLVCNSCHELLLESRTREMRSQQLKKPIATASS
ncbi:hypothetical protein ANANG_G00161920 [Anguilla anguilla]|uniref:phosphatidylinositol-3,5-bisphosphate 3-phosphatase n=1 Tax=Anguilla anguilla TaxID=7936 RepID=A0A9D3RVA6_ANGAN|nr:hypothetical protein ANANG_G00161920 [Anguilla anguilla]